MVKRKAEQCGRQVYIAFHATDLLFIKTNFNEPGNHGTGSGAQFRWFQDGAVAGGNGRDQWRHQQLKRVIPGGDDEAGPFRLIINPVSGQQAGHGFASPFWLHPSAKVIDGKTELTVNEDHFCNSGFKTAFSQVALQGGINVVLIFFNGGGQCF
ncbi:hypothetical protein D3C87_1454420 [compost metagenome]